MLNLTEQGQAAAALLGLGPALQAYRAVRGDDESQSTKTATAVQVQAMLKMCEVVSESLPELVVQLLVLQESGSRPPVVIVSMASSPPHFAWLLRWASVQRSERDGSLRTWIRKHISTKVTWM